MTKRPTVGAVTALTVAALLTLGGAGWWYRTSRPEYRFQSGSEAARTGDFIHAERYADDLEESGQTNLSLLLRAEIQFHRGAAESALGFVNQIKGEGEIQKRASVLAAQCFIALKNPRQAELALLLVLSQDQDHVDAHRWLAVIYYDQGDSRHAIVHLERVAALDPADERPQFLLGLIYKDLGQMAEAVKAFTESLGRKPNGPKAVETRLALAEAQIQFLQAADALKTLEGLDSEAATSLKAEALIAQGRIGESVALLDAALAKSHGHGGLLRLRAERFREAGEYAAAVRLLEQAVALDSADHRARYQLALCYEAQGRTKDAALQHKMVNDTHDIINQIHDLSGAAMKDPWDPAVRYRLADLCDKLDRPKLAKMWRDAAAACRPRPSPQSMGTP